mmetsp:Transcript_20197/g.49535  ORF Transcript_20197/g.49535 Transcript_20197/m.49535 type:complete len:360 (-) Transcript_20197:4363-5442(-)
MPPISVTDMCITRTSNPFETNMTLSPTSSITNGRLVNHFEGFVSSEMTSTTFCNSFFTCLLDFPSGAIQYIGTWSPNSNQGYIDDGVSCCFNCSLAPWPRLRTSCLCRTSTVFVVPVPIVPSAPRTATTSGSNPLITSAVGRGAIPRGGDGDISGLGQETLSLGDSGLGLLFASSHGGILALGSVKLHFRKISPSPKASCRFRGSEISDGPNMRRGVLESFWANSTAASSDPSFSVGMRRMWTSGGTFSGMLVWIAPGENSQLWIPAAELFFASFLSPSAPPQGQASNPTSLQILVTFLLLHRPILRSGFHIPSEAFSVKAYVHALSTSALPSQRQGPEGISSCPCLWGFHSPLTSFCK